MRDSLCVWVRLQELYREGSRYLTRLSSTHNADKLIWVGIALTLTIGLFIRTAEAIQLNGIVTDGSNPVPGARVRPQGKSMFVLTDSNGLFELTTPDEPLANYTVTAGKEGWITGGAKVSPKTTYTTIVMRKIPDTDNPNYNFITPHKSTVDLRLDNTKLTSLRIGSHTTFKESCNLCHFEPSCYLCHREIYKQWSVSQHARAVTNQWTQNMYSGTDANGVPGVGPGYKLDFPGQTGDCADCHAPSAAIRAPGNTDLAVVNHRGTVAFPTVVGSKTIQQMELERAAGSVDADGVHCDFCHKIKEVTVNDKAGVNGSISMYRPAKTDENTKRQADGRLPPIFAYGPFDDVVDFSSTSEMAITSPMVASYNPVYSTSEYCSACHQHRNEHGMPFMDTYREWKESPYAKLGIECQDCHMKPDQEIGYGTVVNGDAEKFWTPLEFRDVSTISRHDFPGAQPSLVQNAAAFSIEAIADKGELNIDISVRNVNAGHYLPSGITIRNMLLLVTPITETGDTLVYTGSNRVPAYGGIGEFSKGNYSGYPGKGFALVFGDDKGVSPVMDWQATKMIEDTRLKPRGSSSSQYTFKLPSSGQKIDIHTKLIYRRAFKPLADIKKWTQEDIIVTSDVTTVTNEPKMGSVTGSTVLSLYNRVMSKLIGIL